MSREPHPKAPGLAAGITEPMIHDLVHEFYARVRRDDVLGPVFNTVVQDWDEHLEKLCEFWSSVTLLTGRYKGAPMQVHAALAQIDTHHFVRWLQLFAVTVQEMCPPDAAALFIDRSERIAQSLQLGISLRRSGGLPFPIRSVGAMDR